MVLDLAATLPPGLSLIDRGSLGGPHLPSRGTADASLALPGIARGLWYLSVLRQVLSTQHRWNAGRGAEDAVYCNALMPDSFTLSAPELKRLAQGDMQVSTVCCAKCSTSIGWKFCALAPQASEVRNINQVIVSSRMLENRLHPHG